MDIDEPNRRWRWRNCDTKYPKSLPHVRWYILERAMSCGSVKTKEVCIASSIAVKVGKGELPNSSTQREYQSSASL